MILKLELNTGKIVSYQTAYQDFYDAVNFLLGNKWIIINDNEVALTGSISRIFKATD